MVPIPSRDSHRGLPAYSECINHRHCGAPTCIERRQRCVVLAPVGMQSVLTRCRGRKAERSAKENAGRSESVPESRHRSPTRTPGIAARRTGDAAGKPVPFMRRFTPSPRSSGQPMANARTSTNSPAPRPRPHPQRAPRRADDQRGRFRCAAIRSNRSARIRSGGARSSRSSCAAAIADNMPTTCRRRADRRRRLGDSRSPSRR